MTDTPKVRCEDPLCGTTHIHIPGLRRVFVDEPPKVAYLVVSGFYCDVRVHAVFSTRELGEAWIAAKGTPAEYEIEESPLDP